MDAYLSFLSRSNRLNRPVGVARCIGVALVDLKASLALVRERELCIDCPAGLHLSERICARRELRSRAVGFLGFGQRAEVVSRESIYS